MIAAVPGCASDSIATLRPDNHANAAGSTARRVVLLLLLTLATPLGAIEREQANAIPHVDQRARDNFLQYIYADPHKAFAIAPGGGWAWSSATSNSEEAKKLALARCQKHTAQRCVLYALNDKVVFQRQQWPQLWGPYLTAKQAAAAPVGLTRGSRFPDLLFKDRKGKPLRLRDFRGKVTLLHFWGSWCPPCMREMPLLQQLQTQLQQSQPPLSNKVAMVLLQVREPFQQSLAWSQHNQFDNLPLYDSGVSSSNDAQLRVSGKTGAKHYLPDRDIAIAFPTSYVLDRHGIVLFAHSGPIDAWNEYLPFLRHAATHSGR